MKGPPNAVPTYITDANSFSFQIMIMTNKERVVNKSIIKSNNFSFELWFQPTNKLGVLEKVDCYATRAPANPNLLMRRAGVDQRTIVCFHLYITTLYSFTIHTLQQCKILQVVHHNIVQYYNAISLLRDCYFSQS